MSKRGDNVYTAIGMLLCFFSISFDDDTLLLMGFIMINAIVSKRGNDV